MKSPAHLHFSSLRYRLQNWLRNHNAQTPFHCGDGTLRLNQRPVGLTTRDLETPTAGPRELLPARLERLGLDLAYVKVFHTSTYQNLARVCASCKDWRRCARDLASGDVQSGMGSYCLNTPCFDALLVGRPPWEERHE